MSLCPYNPATRSASAMAIPEAASVDPEQVHLRLHGDRRRVQVRAQLGLPAVGGDPGVAVRRDRQRRTGRLAAAVASARATTTARARRRRWPRIARTGAATRSTTRWSTRSTPSQIIWPNWVENPFNQANLDSLWMMSQEYFSSTGASPYQPSLKDSALQRTRYRELAPGSECGNFAYIDRLEHDHIEDGRWASTAHQHAAHPGVLADPLHAQRIRTGRRVAVGLQPVHHQGVPDDAGVLRRRGHAWLDGGLHRARQAASARPAAWPGRRARSWPRDLPGDDQPHPAQVPHGPQRRRACASTATAAAPRLVDDLRLGV